MRAVARVAWFGHRMPRQSQPYADLTLKRLHWLRFFDLLATVFARPARIIIPKIKHRLAEMLDDVRAVKMNVFNQRTAIFAVKNYMFFLPWRPTPLHHNTDRVGRPLRRMRYVCRNEECFAFANNVIDDAIAFTDPHFDIAFELVKIFLGVHEMEIVPSVRSRDDHDKKIAAIVEITIADRRLEEVAIFCDPIVQVDRCPHRSRATRRRRFLFGTSKSINESGYFLHPAPSNGSTAVLRVVFSILTIGSGVIGRAASKLLLNSADCQMPQPSLRASNFAPLLALCCALIVTGCENLPLNAGGPGFWGGTSGGGYWRGDRVSGRPKIVVHVGEQRAYFYKGKKIVGESTVSTGKRGFDTPPGHYRVIEKDKNHVSSEFGDYVDAQGQVVQANIDVRKDSQPRGTHFDGARMPYFMRFNGGYGMHAGYVPRFRASHGCIRLPARMAKHFYENAPEDTPVIVREY